MRNTGSNIKRISKNPYNLKEVIKSIENSDASIALDYRLNLIQTAGDTYLLIDSGTYCGLEIYNASSDNPSMRIIIGGIYMDAYYNDRGHHFKKGYSYDNNVDLNDAYIELVKLEKINKDSFQDMFICLLDYKMRGGVS